MRKCTKIERGEGGEEGEKEKEGGGNEGERDKERKTNNDERQKGTNNIINLTLTIH